MYKNVYMIAFLVHPKESDVSYHNEAWPCCCGSSPSGAIGDVPAAADRTGPASGRKGSWCRNYGVLDFWPIAKTLNHQITNERTVWLIRKPRG